MTVRIAPKLCGYIHLRNITPLAQFGALAPHWLLLLVTLLRLDNTPVSNYSTSVITDTRHCLGRNVGDTGCQLIATALDDLVAIQRMVLPLGLVPRF